MNGEYGSASWRLNGRVNCSCLDPGLRDGELCDMRIWFARPPVALFEGMPLGREGVDMMADMLTANLQHG